MLSNPVIEAMESCRAIRYLRSDPISDEVLETLLYAATRASSPNNTQLWDFVIVRDVEQRRRIASVYASSHHGVLDGPLPENRTSARTVEGVRHLIGALEDVPVIVFVCARNMYPDQPSHEKLMWSAAYAASQNLIVAARSLGVGTLFSTLHLHCEPEMRAILDIPDEVYIATTIPLGWPDRPFGPLTRKPLEEVLHCDRW